MVAVAVKPPVASPKDHLDSWETEENGEPSRPRNVSQDKEIGLGARVKLSAFGPDADISQKLILRKFKPLEDPWFLKQGEAKPVFP